MTKKHFKAIAEIIKTSHDKVDVILKLSSYFKTVNSNFDKERFLKACK